MSGESSKAQIERPLLMGKYNIADSLPLSSITKMERTARRRWHQGESSLSGVYSRHLAKAWCLERYSAWRLRRSSWKRYRSWVFGNAWRPPKD